MTIQIIRVAQLNGHTGAVYDIAADHLGAIWSVGGDGWVVRWDALHSSDGVLVARADVQLFSVCLVPSRSLLVAGDMKGALHWIDVSVSAQYAQIQTHRKGVFAIQWYDEKIYSAGGDGVLTMWELDGQQPPMPQVSHTLSNERLRCMAFSPDGSRLLVGASDGNLYELNPHTLELVHTLHQAHTSSVFTVAYSPCGLYVYTGGRDALLKKWSATDIARGALCTVAAHWFTINKVAVHPKGHLLATASRDKTIKIWDSTDLKLLKVIDVMKYRGHTHSVNKLLWLNDTQLVSCGDDKKIYLWSIDVI